MPTFDDSLADFPPVNHELGFNESHSRHFRFSIKVNGECWEWAETKGGGGGGGGGRYTLRDKKWSAHRLAWTLCCGPIPEGLRVLHDCDNRSCVRPSHLYLGTNADRVRKQVEHGRHSRGEDHSNASLTEEEVGFIREAHGLGMSWAEIARFLGKSYTTVYFAGTGRTWRHVK